MTVNSNSEYQTDRERASEFEYALSGRSRVAEKKERNIQNMQTTAATD